MAYKSMQLIIVPQYHFTPGLRYDPFIKFVIHESVEACCNQLLTAVHTTSYAYIISLFHEIFSQKYTFYD